LAPPSWLLGFLFREAPIEFADLAPGKAMAGRLARLVDVAASSRRKVAAWIATRS
jgi:hypothetical protein